MYAINPKTGDIDNTEEEMLRMLYKDTIYYDWFKLSLRHAHENNMTLSVQEYDDHIKAGGSLFYDVVEQRAEKKKVQE